MVFIKKLPLLSLISSEKNDTRSSTRAPAIKQSDEHGRACWCWFVFYPRSEVSLGSVQVAFLTRLRSVAYLCHSLSPHASTSRNRKTWFVPFFFLIALFYWLKILQVCNLIKPPLGCCSTWGTGSSHGDRNENVFILTVLKWLGNCNSFPMEWHIIRPWIVLIDDLFFCL